MLKSDLECNYLDPVLAIFNGLEHGENIKISSNPTYLTLDSFGDCHTGVLGALGHAFCARVFKFEFHNYFLGNN